MGRQPKKDDVPLIRFSDSGIYGTTSYTGPANATTKRSIFCGLCYNHETHAVEGAANASIARNLAGALTVIGGCVLIGIGSHLLIKTEKDTTSSSSFFKNPDNDTGIACVSIGALLFLMLGLVILKGLCGNNNTAPSYSSGYHRL